MKQRLIQKELKVLDAYSLESVEKGHLYEVYNHYLHYSDFMSATTRTTTVPATMFSLSLSVLSAAFSSEYHFRS